MKLSKSLAALVVAGAAAPAAFAVPFGPNLVTNGAFDISNVTSVDYTAYADAVRLTSTSAAQAAGWTVETATTGNLHAVFNDALCSPAGSKCTTSYGTTDAHSASSFIDLTGGKDTNGRGFDLSISQTLATVAGETYEVSFWLLNDGTYSNNQSAMVLVDFDGTSQLAVASATGTWMQYTLTFTAVDASSTLSFNAATTNTALQLLGLDDVSVAVSVPEPESYALFLAGLAAVGASARRRKQAAA